MCATQPGSRGRQGIGYPRMPNFAFKASVRAFLAPASPDYVFDRKHASEDDSVQAKARRFTVGNGWKGQKVIGGQSVTGRPPRCSRLRVACVRRRIEESRGG